MTVNDVLRLVQLYDALEFLQDHPPDPSAPTDEHDKHHQMIELVQDEMVTLENQ